MAVSAAKITGVQDTVYGNERVRTRRLTFSSNYATGGETIAASLFGLKRISRLSFHGGAAAAADVATGIPFFYNQATGKLVFFEGSSAGTALSEKTNSEAYPTGCFIDVTAFGYGGAS